MNAATAAVMNAVQSHHQEKAEKAAAQGRADQDAELPSVDGRRCSSR